MFEWFASCWASGRNLGSIQQFARSVTFHYKPRRPSPGPSHRVNTLSVFCCYRAEKYGAVVKEIRSEFSAIPRKFQEFLSWFYIWEGIWYSERKCCVFIKRNIYYFDFVGISQPKKALFGVSDLKSPLRFACEIVCIECTYK